MSQPVPELPVTDVVLTQRYYRDYLGFEIGWLLPNEELGAVSRDDAAIILRKTTQPFDPSAVWIYAENVDDSYNELQSVGARIVEPLEDKPWGLRQFQVEDLDGNRFYFHHD